MAPHRLPAALIRAAAVLALVLCSCRPAAAAEKPNVVIISLDFAGIFRVPAVKHLYAGEPGDHVFAGLFLRYSGSRYILQAGA